MEEEQKKDDVLQAVVLSSLDHRTNRLRDLDTRRVFHLDEIKKNCVKYRLRFLPAGRFKGRLPMQAVYELRALEARAEEPIRGFMIMAPAKRFKLCDCDADPLLFVPVGGDRYYLVHRWGADMGPWRAVMGWPVRGWTQLAITVVAIAWITAALLPTVVITTDPTVGWWGSHRVFTFFWTTMFGTAVTAFCWFTFFGQFSREVWNSRNFN